MDWPSLQLLELIVRIGELKSLSKAAEKCGIAQPNASRSISRLERRLGLPLIVRSSSGSKLSSTGELVAKWAGPLLKAGEEFEVTLSSLQKDSAEQLHVLASQTVAESYAPSWLARFQSTHPHISVQLSVHNSTVIMQKVLAGDIRLGLIESLGIQDGLSSCLLGYDQLILVVNPSHPWAKRRRRVGLAQLADTPLVVREPGSGTREVLDFTLSGLNQVPPAMVASSNSAVVGSVLAGVAPAVCSKQTVRAALATKQLVSVEIEHPERFVRPLRAIWAAGNQLLGPAAEFVSAIRS